MANLRGVGVGLRDRYVEYILQNKPPLDWFEVLADNYLHPHSMALPALMAIREHYPMALHSVGMSLGATEPLNKAYFDRYKALIDLLQPAVVSDHLCWVSGSGQYLHELLPLPHTQEAIDHVSQRIRQVQDWLGRRIAIENVSSYMRFVDDEMTEWEFVNQVAKKADCHILFDINNVYVNSVNHDLIPLETIQHIDASRVQYCHLAGFDDCGTHLLDSHGAAVYDEVWALYQMALERFNAVPTLIEWDTNLPEFDVLFAQAEKARRMMEAVHD